MNHADYCCSSPDHDLSNTLNTLLLTVKRDHDHLYKHIYVNNSIMNNLEETETH
jgi:hypothetical protein